MQAEPHPAAHTCTRKSSQAREAVCRRQKAAAPACGCVKFQFLRGLETHGCPAGVFSASAMVKEALLNCGGRDPATTESTAGTLRLPSWSAATTVSRYSLSCCRGRPVVRTWPFFLSTSKRPSPPAKRARFNAT